MARQRVRPLLLLKKKSAMFQRVGRNTYALANRTQSTTLGTIRVVAGWTGLANCAVAVQAVTHEGETVTHEGEVVTHG